ncbi:hypothetical protein ACF1BP_22560 [Streptomyces sp. NPDC014735]|uniref:hypothetical protein n=1 Tax=Streptomyces sp. NPDC014735 TaxID=3364887 RepID=UPI0036FB6174
MRSTPTTTDGWRGLPGPDFAEPQLLAVLNHCAAQDVLGEDVLVGYDGRAGAPELAQLAADLLAEHGITAHLATGPAPTPACGVLVHQDTGLSAAVIITASHNPPGYTGMKIRDSAGHGIVWPQPPPGAMLDPGRLARHAHPAVDVLAPYSASTGAALDEAAEHFDAGVLLDAVHGAVGALDGHLGAVKICRARPLPFFAGHTPDPVPRTQAEQTARAILEQTPGPTLLAMTDGDGDRLVLFTRRSGYIGSPEQAAALMYAGLPVDRLITTAVAPRMAVRAAKRAQPGLRVTETPVGFKHIVTAWQNNPTPTLGLEPNGALAHAADNNGYFERDSLAALTAVLHTFPTLDSLDEAIAELRRLHPHTQLVHTVPQPLTAVLHQLPGLLPGWRADHSGDPVVYDDGAHGRIAVRASGTEPATRLYIEAPAPVVERLTGALGGPAFNLPA